MIANRVFISISVWLVYSMAIQPLVAQSFDPFIQSQVDALSFDSLVNKLQTFEDLGIKEVGSQNLNETGEWIIDLYEQWGYTDIETDSFNLGNNQVYNIIVTKTGTDFPNTYFIIDGHYDTYNGPGVNDNGTGTAIVLEVARMFKDLDCRYSIKFIHFTAEELGLIGSYHYVENTVLPQNMDIRLVFNIDEVGGVAGEVNNTITCERDEWPPNANNDESAAFTDTLANLTMLYSNLDTWINYAYGTDYIPFMENGYVITGFYEFNESPYPHSINDSLANLDPDYVFEITKASLAASLYFSEVVNTTSDIDIRNHKDEMITIVPNPFHETIILTNTSEERIILSVFDLSGRNVFNQKLGAKNILQVKPGLEPGMYLYSATSVEGRLLSSGNLICK